MSFETFSPWLNVAIFAGAAAIVWIAGTKLANYADAIAERTAFSRVLLGVVLLGIATSLPEIATTLTASWHGNAQLVSGNLFGGVALQVAILAIVDVVAVRGALTYFTPQPVLLFQGVMLLLLLGVAVAGAAAGDPLAVAGIGLTTVLLTAGYIAMVLLTHSGALPAWRATNVPEDKSPALDDVRRATGDDANARLYTYCGVSAGAIFAAGWALARTGGALADQTGLGASFVGVALVAWSTSLPELSTTLAAVRRGNHQMAVSNILGTNCLELALFLPADLVYRGGPLLGALDRSAMFAAGIGIVVTSIFLLGLLERRDRTMLRMGIDSAAVLAAYACGLAGLYALR